LAVNLAGRLPAVRWAAISFHILLLEGKKMTLQRNFLEYKKQMKNGIIRQAYQGIMEYIMQLRNLLQKKFPDYSVGNMYIGYMDMTYFPLFPKKLRKKKLKIAIVFLHEFCRFEVWLSGNNRLVQQQYSRIIVEKQWDKYQTNPSNPDSIIEHIIVENPDFDHPDVLTKQIETSTTVFIRDIEEFISKQKK
jgi:hypothetical protein